MHLESLTPKPNNFIHPVARSYNVQWISVGGVQPILVCYGQMQDVF